MLRRALIATLIAGPAFGQTGNFVSPRIILEEYGVFCPDEATGRMEAPDTESGFIDLISGDPRVDFHTDIVPTELGLGFGMRFRLAGNYPPTPGRIIITHPPFGTPPVTRESYDITVESASISMTQFDFDAPYEMQQGTWTIAVEIEGEILLSHAFTVVGSGETPVSVKMCDGPPLMS